VASGFSLHYSMGSQDGCPTNRKTFVLASLFLLMKRL
jgi:hypothetical protein